MNRSTTGKGSKWKLVWNDEFDGRELDPAKWDFELGNKFFDYRTHQWVAEIPPTLTHRIELFRQTGRVFKVPTELFGENSWIQAMLGQGLVPEQYHPIVNMMDDEELQAFLTGIHSAAERLVEQLPEHQRFIDHYCRAKP